MIRDLKALYTAVVDNEVVLFETNLKLFVEKLNKMEPSSRNYQYYYRQFQKKKLLTQELGSKKYHIQELM
ncbi:hypothetical protein [Flagellimonas sp. SN16]|uniref:hypothetical protein n=1 Tax=Flagellimonas sp. SN16 TaxID=3415142 RepID=UPI003C688D7D